MLHIFCITLPEHGSELCWECFVTLFSLQTWFIGVLVCRSCPTLTNGTEKKKKKKRKHEARSLETQTKRHRADALLTQVCAALVWIFSRRDFGVHIVVGRRVHALRYSVSS